MFVLSVSEERALRSVERPEGSPTEPVAPPIWVGRGVSLAGGSRSVDTLCLRERLRCAP